MGCLFCNSKEPNYKPGPEIDFICSRCVMLLSAANQDDLKQAHDRAIKKGYLGKAKAIKSFIIEDKANVRKTKKPKRGMVGKRPLRKGRPALHQVRA